MKIMVSACLLGQNCKYNGGNNYSEKVDLVILQSRSPSCGVKQVYDGSFSGKLIEGKGIFAELLAENGIKTIDLSELLEG